MFDLTLIQLKVLLRTLVFSGVRVTRSLVVCVCFVDHWMSFCPFSFGHCVVVYSSSINGFWLPLWYLQTLLILHKVWKKNEMSWIYSITWIQKFKNSRKRLCFNAIADFQSSYNFVVVLCLVNCWYTFYSSWIQICMCQLTVVCSSKLILLWW